MTVETELPNLQNPPSPFHESLHEPGEGLVQRLRDQVDHHPLQSLVAMAGVGLVAVKVLPWLMRGRLLKPVFNTALRTAATIAIPIAMEAVMKAVMGGPAEKPVVASSRSRPYRRA